MIASLSPRAKPSACQPGGERFDLGGDLGPAPALPDAVILLAHRRAVGALAGHAPAAASGRCRADRGRRGRAGNRRELCRGSSVARHPASLGAAKSCLGLGAPHPPMPDRARMVKPLGSRRRPVRAPLLRRAATSGSLGPGRIPQPPEVSHEDYRDPHADRRIAGRRAARRRRGKPERQAPDRDVAGRRPMPASRGSASPISAAR